MTCDILLDVGGTGIKGSVVTNGEIHLPYAEFPAHASESRDVLAKHERDYSRFKRQHPRSTGRYGFPGSIRL